MTKTTLRMAVNVKVNVIVALEKGGVILLFSQLCKFRANERNVSLLTSCTASAAETRAVIN